MDGSEAQPRCENCGAPVDSRLQACSYCQAQLRPAGEIACPHCGRTIPPPGTTCPWCRNADPTFAGQMPH